MRNFLPVLKSSSLFADIEEQDLENLLSCLQAQKIFYHKGETILSAGDPAQQIGIVLSGGVQVVREDYYGNRSMMGKLEPGDMFAEAFACAGISSMPVNVTASEDSEVLMIDAWRITHSCENACGFHHQLIYNMMRILAVKNLICNQKIEVVSQRSTRDKLMAYLMQQAQKHGSNQFEIPYDRQELADYLEVDRSGLSAEISRLRREGVLLCERNRFTLLVPEA